MNLSIFKRSLLAIKRWFGGGSPPAVSATVSGMIALLELTPQDMAIEFLRDSGGKSSAVFIRYDGPHKWLEGNMHAVRIRLTADGMWLDTPVQEKVELNWRETELLQDAVDAWVAR